MNLHTDVELKIGPDDGWEPVPARDLAFMGLALGAVLLVVVSIALNLTVGQVDTKKGLWAKNASMGFLSHYVTLKEFNALWDRRYYNKQFKATWVGAPVISNPQHPKIYGYMDKTEIGLRSDGVVVWHSK